MRAPTGGLGPRLESGVAHAGGHSSAGHSSPHGSHKAPGVARNSHGRIKRSTVAKSAFRATHPCPSTGRSTGACPGYITDHVTPLKRGGADSPSNIQWQATEAAKAEDRTE